MTQYVEAAGGVVRDGVTHIPADPGNRDWQAYEVWLAEGNLPAEPEPEPPPVPAAISDRQFAQVLALDGVISEDEALAWAARGELPIPIETALEAIPEADGQRFAARMLLASATTYERGHPLVPMLGTLLGYDAAALDDIWTRAGGH